ncbi:MAG: flippase-like domain-containing protein [Ardenticatenaceae bacterium]|nr:flippase-like domain-containing protein [Ardenticatenaceae bacterium]HBY97113.1 hypothetical protein [Chloroflexota bacterium]
MSAWRRGRWLLHLVGLALFAWVLTRIDIRTLVRHVLEANWLLVTLALALGLPFIWLKSERWRMVLEWTGSRISAGLAFRLFSIGLLAGLVTPGQVGEFAKAFGVRREGGTLRSGLTASVGDRALDVAMLLGLSAYYAVWHRYRWPTLNSLAVFLASMALVGILAAWIWLVAAQLFVAFPLRWPVTGRALGEAITGFPWPRMVSLAAATLFAYALYSIRLYLLLLALGQSAPVPVFVSSMAVMSLAALLPISIAGIGSRDAALLVLFGEFRIPQEAAIAFSFLVLVLSLFNAVVGAIAWALQFIGEHDEPDTDASHQSTAGVPPPLPPRGPRVRRGMDEPG